MNSLKGIPDEVEGPRTRVDMGDPAVAASSQSADATLQKAHDEVAAAIAAAEESTRGVGSASAAPTTAAGTAEGDPGEPPAQ
jgi:hypothetical protein